MRPEATAGSDGRAIMATLITVHGTFAHMPLPPGEDPTKATTPQWWENDSAFSDEMRARLSGDGQPLTIDPFVWSGDNSERGRRLAARRLLDRFEQIEATGERYAAVGHSHGGSVLANALLLAAAEKKPLPGLQTWLTVGTPFVELRKERLLFLRLPLIFKAIFIGSLMLFFMFAFDVAGDFFNGRLGFDNERRWQRLGMSTLLVSLPFLVYYAGVWWFDRARLFQYRKPVRDRAHAFFADRWLAITHEDDEAVRGLGAIESTNFKIFSSEFAVPVIALSAVFLLPFAYLSLLSAPNTMVGIAQFFKTEVYKLEDYSPEIERMETDLAKLRTVRRQIRQMRSGNATRSPGTGQDLTALINERRKMRREMRQKFPEFREVSRAVRFKRRFFEERGRACANGQLCGAGEDWKINSKLLFYLVNDEASTLVLDPEQRPRGTFGRLLTALIPILLVPIVFAVVSVAFVLLVQWLARIFSYGLSLVLDRATKSEINRAALGNDTESEVALRAIPRPNWVQTEAEFLPTELGDLVAARSNEAAVETIARLRNMLSELTIIEDVGNRNQSLLAILSWQELIHMVYFEVPEIRSVIVAALASKDGFDLKGQVDSRSMDALAQIQPQLRTTDPGARRAVGSASGANDQAVAASPSV